MLVSAVTVRSELFFAFYRISQDMLNQKKLGHLLYPIWEQESSCRNPLSIQQSHSLV